jgi:hypothetical protein
MSLQGCGQAVFENAKGGIGFLGRNAQRWAEADRILTATEHQ